MFSELENLVQMERFATEQIPLHREMNWISKESTDIVAIYEPDDSDDNTPKSNGDKNEVFHAQGAVATIHRETTLHPGKGCIMKKRQPHSGWRQEQQ